MLFSLNVLVLTVVEKLKNETVVQIFKSAGLNKV